MKLANVMGATGMVGVALLAGACSMGHDNTAALPTAPNLPATPADMADASARPAGTTVDFSRPDSTTASAPATIRTSASSTTDQSQSIRQLALYGQLPDAAPQHAGPMDGPDNLTHVTFAFEGSDFDPAVDPTGQWLVYASTQHRQTADLYIKRVNGTTVTQLTNDMGNHVMPAFSPDGKRIAFASDRGGNFAIYMMDAQGGQPVQVTNDSNDNIHPSFSHDGKELVYCSHGGQSGQWEMVMVDVDNPASKHFIGNGLFPTFSPVDNRILFQRANERGSRWFSIWTIELVNGEGMRPTEIAASANAALITPTWSPEGRHIAFCTVLDPAPDDHTHPSQADIWIINADGTGRVNLTHSPTANLQPVWAHDGTIYFTSNRGKDSNENIWSVRPDSALQVADRADGGDNSAGRPQGEPMGMAAPTGHIARASSQTFTVAPADGASATPSATDSGSSPTAAHSDAARPPASDSSALAPSE